MKLLAADPFGPITQPSTFVYNGSINGLTDFTTNIVRLLFLIAGLYAFFNLILAGYAFLSAGDDSKKVEAAWAKIWQSIIGLLFIVGSFVIIGVFSYILTGTSTAFLRIVIYGPRLTP
jgi:hypothetical protein